MAATCQIFVGFDAREVAAYQVCVRSLRRKAHRELAIEPLLEPHLRALGLYRRRHERRDGRLWDTISQAPMSTEFALTRFLVPRLARTDWAVFCDCDFLFRADVGRLMALADPRFAVMVVKHRHVPTTGSKMDGQIQLAYPRKNWSSLVLWNCRHPAHAALADAIDVWTGRRLHAFDWLDDSEIGELPPTWNWLEGESDPSLVPDAVHYTRGTPDLPGYADARFADEWRAVLAAPDGASPAGAAGIERADRAAGAAALTPAAA